jgi:hypothetical protein
MKKDILMTVGIIIFMFALFGFHAYLSSLLKQPDVVNQYSVPKIDTTSNCFVYVDEEVARISCKLQGGK